MTETLGGNRARLWATTALILIVLVNAFNHLDRYVLSLLLPQIKAEFQLSDSALGVLSSLPFTLSYVGCCLPAAWIADRWNRRNVVALGLSLWSAMTMAFGAATSFMQMIVFRFVVGVGESASLAPSVSIVGDLYQGARRSIALALVAASGAAGLMVGFPIIGWIAENDGWRAAFFWAGAPGLLLAVVFFLVVREPKRQVADRNRPERAKVGATFATLLRTPSYVWVVVGGCIFSLNLGAMHAWTPTFLNRVHDLGPESVGIYVGAFRGPLGIAGALVGGVLGGFLSSLSPRWRLLLPALAMLLIVPADLMLLLSDQPWVWQVGLGADAFLSYVMFAPNMALCLSLVRPEMRTTATALFITVAQVSGQALGPFGVGVANDLLAPMFGNDAVRYSLMVAPAAGAAGALCYVIALRWLRADTARAEAS